MSKKGRTKNATRTIRLEAEQEDALIKEAERRGFSVNALIGHIFDRYLTSYRFYDIGGMVVFSSETAQEFLQKIDVNDVREIGEEAGKARIRGGLLQRGRRINMDSFTWYVTQVLGENYGWFRCDYREEENQATFHLQHQLGYKWSVFVGSYISSAVQDLLGMKCNLVIMNNAVNIEVTQG